jgi:hypothetical protein
MLQRGTDQSADQLGVGQAADSDQTVTIGCVGVLDTGGTSGCWRRRVNASALRTRTDSTAAAGSTTAIGRRRNDIDMQ